VRFAQTVLLLVLAAACVEKVAPKGSAEILEFSDRPGTEAPTSKVPRLISVASTEPDAILREKLWWLRHDVSALLQVEINAQGEVLSSKVLSESPSNDGLAMEFADVGDGWLIFGLPPAELAIHPADGNDVHELYLMCDDVEGFVTDMASRGFACEPPADHGWGVLTRLTLPGGGQLGVYQPRHPRPEPMRAGEHR
jgi:hypothetical protein